MEIIRTKDKNYSLSIQMRLILIFIFTSVIAFAVNLYMNINTNKIVSTIDIVYISNSNLGELSNALVGMQNNIKEYLDTKSSGSLENYYRNEQDYTKYLDKLSDKITDRDSMLMEKNIKNMSVEYFERAKETVQAKRARNIPAYKESFEETTRMYQYISTYINSLNNVQFQYNSSNYKKLMVSLEYLSKVSTVIYLVVAILNIFLIFIMIKSITNPLKELAEAANKVAGGDFDIELLTFSQNDEVGVVSKAFNRMIISIREYIEEIKESMEFKSKMKEKELLMLNHIKDAQLKYLQAQVNPHFLFNSLNAAAQLAMLENAERTFTFVEKLADFFRYNLKKTDKDTTLSEEFEMIDNYIYIMNVRFSGEIHFEKEISCKLEDIRVPGMILQPIVENAVNYGIRDMEQEGKITLGVHSIDDGIRIQISDNGKGMTKDSIYRVIEGEEEQDKKERAESNGIGLRNVISRLQLYYRREDILRIYSEGLSKGTDVIIDIPTDRCTRRMGEK